MANRNENGHMEGGAGGVNHNQENPNDQNQDGNDINPQGMNPLERDVPPFPAFEFNVGGPNPDDFGISDSDAKAIAIFARNELFVPLKLTFLTLAAFWSIYVHGSLFIFFTLAVFLFGLSIFTVRDVPGPYPTIATRSIFQMLEIRTIQLFMMYCQLLLIHLLSWLTLPFIHFRNFEKLREEVLGFFSKKSLASVHWTAYLRISNQLFWLSFTWMVTARMIANLFVMSRIPSFRSLLRYEVETLTTATITIWIGFVAFNSVAGTFAGFTPLVTVMLLSLLAWVVSTHLRSTIFKPELDIPRDNDFRGMMRVMTVIMSQLIVGGLLCSLLSLITSVTITTLSIPTSTALPEDSLHKYARAVRTKNSNPFAGENVVELNLNLLLVITSQCFTTRLLKHRYDINKLDRVLERMVPDNGR